MRVPSRERGASAVELAIVLPLMMLLIGGIVDFGRAFYTKVTITNSAREGARAAMFPGTSNSTDVQARAFQALGGSPGADYSVTLSASCPTAAGATPTTTTVTVTRSNFTWVLLGPAMSLFGAGGTLPSTLSGHATMQCGG